MSRKRRSLRPDEEELWKKVADTASPLQHRPPKGVVPQGGRAEGRKPEPAQVQPFAIGSKLSPRAIRHDLARSIRHQLSSQPVQMDDKAFGRLKRGKLTPEGRIDLHGMTLAEAQPALIGYILNARAQGKRLVLVITGKGRTGPDLGPIPERRGILKHHVPQWLRSPPLAAAVLQVAQAHARHGGSGAYYVYLRRIR